MSKYVIKNPNDIASDAQVDALANKFSFDTKGKKNFALEKQIWATLNSFRDTKVGKTKLFTKEKAHLLFDKSIKKLPKVYDDARKAYLKANPK